jgi:hypothetical protein
MKRRNIFQSAMAAGLALSSIAISTLTIGSSAALADDSYTDSELLERCRSSLNSAICDRIERNDRNRNWRLEDSRDRDWRDRYGNRRSYDLRLSEGTSIPTHVSRQGRIVLRRNEQYSLRLITDRDLFSDRSDRVVIPRGSSIYGVLVPYNRGYRFESQYVALRNGGQKDIWAVSDVIDSRDRYTRSNDDSILSPAASIILGTLIGRSITPDNDRLGDIFDRDSRARRDLVVIYPDRDLDLRLSRDFVLRYR